MSSKITTAGAHHIRLIVTDPIRSRDFYTSLLNFTVAAELPPGFVLTNGNTLLAITPVLATSVIHSKTSQPLLAFVKVLFNKQQEIAVLEC